MPSKPAVGLVDPDPLRHGGVDPAVAVDLHRRRVRPAGRDPSGRRPGPSRGRSVPTARLEGPDVVSGRVADVEGPLVGREGQAVGLLEVVEQERGGRRRRLAEVEREDALEVQRAVGRARRRRGGR